MRFAREESNISYTVKELVDLGYKVRTTVRSEAKGEYVKGLFGVEYAVVPDMMTVRGHTGSTNSSPGPTMKQSKVLMALSTLHHPSTLGTRATRNSPSVLL